MSSAWEKHIMLKPWDLVSKILGGGLFASSSKATLNEKIELYFNDHEFAPLMLQENYLGTNPILANQYSGQRRNLKILELTDNAAESISDGDLVDAMIHGSQQHWSLMPTHAVFSFVRPASFVSGSMAGHQTRFTSWLGNNSKSSTYSRKLSWNTLINFAVRLVRLVKEIQGHMRLRASGDRHEIRQQYLPVLWTRLIKGLELHGDTSTGVDSIIDLMDSYFLTKDDWEAILELGIGSQRPENVSLPSTTKTRFTKTYNQKSHPLPFMKASASNLAPPKRGEKPDLEEAIDASEDEEVLMDEAVDSADEVLDLKKDKYVQAPKKKRAAPKKAAAKKKGKPAKEDSDEDISDAASEEAKPKGKGKAKVATGKGRPKK
jgi:replication factor C subunit 1